MTTFKSISSTPTVVSYPSETKDGVYVHTTKLHPVHATHDGMGTQPAFRMARHRTAILHPKYVTVGAVFGVIGLFAAYGLGVMILISNTRHPVKTETPTIPGAAITTTVSVPSAPVATPTALPENSAAPTVITPPKTPIANGSQIGKRAEGSARVLESQKLLHQVKAFNAGFESSDAYRQRLTEKASRLSDTKAGAEASQYLMLIDNTILNARKQAQEAPVVSTPPADEPVVQYGMRSLDVP